MPSTLNPPMIVCTGALDSVRVNAPFTRKLGLTNEDFATKPLLERLHRDDRQAFTDAVETGGGRSFGRIQGSNGAWIPFEFSVRTHGGSPAVLGQIKQAGRKDQLKTRHRNDKDQSTLQQTLHAMAGVVEENNPGLKCSILLVDLATQTVKVGAGPSLPARYNAAVEGLKIGPMVGSCGTAAYWNVPVVVESIADDPLWVDLKGYAADAGVAACWSYPIVASNGTVLGAMALYNSVPSAPEKHHLDGLAIAARMVGLAIERDRLEKELRQASKMEAIGVLAGGVAHDFNNMLVSILGNAELALESLPNDAKAVTMLNELVTASIDASAICDQLLGYAGRRGVATESIECSALLTELGTLSRVAFSKKVRVVYDLAPDAVYVSGDRGQLTQVIMNLLTNAADAIGNNEGSITIGSQSGPYSTEQLRKFDPDIEVQPGEYVRIWVRDTGVGMSPETQRRAFDPFFSTKRIGRGLGLASIRGIASAHKGLLKIDSSEGGGTTFELLLPLMENPPTSLTTRERATVSPAARLLIIDDEPMVRCVLKKILESAGHTVQCAADGVEGVDVFRRHADDIDCVLLDLSMPKLDGEEVFHEIRKIRSDARVILCSGYGEEDVVGRFEKADLAGVLKKPARNDVVIETVAKALCQPDGPQDSGPRNPTNLTPFAQTQCSRQ